eukprot:14046502-Alexandrium_andersonii.AAC.1
MQLPRGRQSAGHGTQCAFPKTWTEEDMLRVFFQVSYTHLTALDVADVKARGPTEGHFILVAMLNTWMCSWRLPGGALRRGRKAGSMRIGLLRALP